MSLLGQLGRICYRHRILTLFAWIVLAASLIMLWMNFGAAADDSFSGSDPGQACSTRTSTVSPGTQLTLAILVEAPIDSPAVKARITSALVRFPRGRGFLGDRPVSRPGQISRDGHVAFATVQFAVPELEIPNTEALALMHDATAASRPRLKFSLGGDVVDLAETPYGGPTEGIGITAAAIVLLIAFGSLLAMGLPVVTAVFGIGAGLSLIALLGHIFPAPSFSPIVASMIGLGVGVDYALFIVTRFREALRAGVAPPDAIAADDADRWPVGPDRWLHGRDRDARPAGAAPAATERGRDRRRRDRGHDRARIADPAACAARLLRYAAGQAVAAAVPGALKRRERRGMLPTRLVLLRASQASRVVAAPAAERWAAVVQRRPVLAAVGVARSSCCSRCPRSE